MKKPMTCYLNKVKVLAGKRGDGIFKSTFKIKCLILLPYLTGFKKQLSLIHYNLVGIGKWSTKGQNMFILEHF